MLHAKIRNLEQVADDLKETVVVMITAHDLDSTSNASRKNKQQTLRT